MAEELNDPYDQSGEGAGFGKPVISWKKADVGDEITGVTLPPEIDLPDKGYRLTQEWDSEARSPKVWAPRGYEIKGKAWRGPVTRDEFDAYLKAEGETEKARPVVRSEVLLQTSFRNFEYVSGPAKARAQEAGEADDGLRRVILDGQSLREAHLEALKAINPDKPKPEVAQTWTVKLASQTPNDKGGHTNGFAVKVAEPTEATRKVVADYIAKAKALAADAAMAGADPYSQEDPPF